LAPDGERFWELIREGERLADRVVRIAEPRYERATRSLLLDHKGYALTRQGRAAEAVETLRQACADAAVGPDRIRARILGDLADALRMLGDTEGAAESLQQAEQLQTRLNFLIDHADHSLSVRAKLTQDRREAYRMLRRAQRTLADDGAKVALARNLLLQARLCTGPCRGRRVCDQVTALLDTTPSLRECPAVKRVLLNWNAWTQGAADPTFEGGDEAFWRI
jgi:tetratricopeptide (TPR) repeat protein